MLLKITSVDMDGYLGRDYHPNKPDIGLIVCVVELFTDVYSGDAMYHGQVIHTLPRSAAVEHREKLSLEAQAAVKDEIAGRDGGYVLSRCWRCITEDGRILDLMDHEVELHQAGR